MERLKLKTASLCPRSKSSSFSCCPGWRKDRHDRAVKPKATPVPWGKMLLVCSVMFVNQFGINLIFPFLPYMIHDFFPELDRTQIGQKAGYLGCAYFVGNFIGSLFWGLLADILGRRPALLWGMCGILLSEIFFAFSQNFAWAVAARFLWGLLNGNIGIGKTYISDICDNTNQAKGFALVGVTRGIGQLLGNLLGGFLSQPASKYSALQFPVFCQYPYSLPVMVGVVLGFISLGSAWLFMDETLSKKNKGSKSTDEDYESSVPSQEDSGIDLSATDPAPDSDTEMVTMTQDDVTTTKNYVISSQPLLVAESDIDTDDCDIERVASDTELLVRERQSRTRRPRLPSCNPLYPCIKFKQRVTDCVATPLQIYRFLKNRRQRGSWSPQGGCSRDIVSRWGRAVGGGFKKRAMLMVDRRVFFSTLMYGLFGVLGVMSLELIPLLLVTGHGGGGYSLDDNELGLLFMVSAVFQLLYHLFMFPLVTKLIGFRNTFRFGIILFGIMTLLLPFSNQITGPIAPSNSSLPSNDTANNGTSDDEDYCIDFRTVSLNSSFESNVNTNSVLRVPFQVWFVLMFIITFIIIGRITSITATMVLINNSSLPGTKGMVNGIGQALAAMGRSIGPAAGAPLFAWSEGTGLGWPINFHFVFDLMVICCVVIILLSLFLPKSIENKRETPPTSTPPSTPELDYTTDNPSSEQDMSPLLNDHSSLDDTDLDDSITNSTTPLDKQVLLNTIGPNDNGLTFDAAPFDDTGDVSAEYAEVRASGSIAVLRT